MNNNFELFSSWPISQGMKNFLSWEEKWPRTLSLGSDSMLLLLQTLSEELKDVNYFSSLDDTHQFFEFFKKLIESKPQGSQVLKEINTINSDIFEKTSLKKSFNSSEAKIAVEYLNLLKFCFEADQGYLLARPEITLRPHHFLILSKIRFESANFLTQFHHTLLTSFECKKFLENSSVLLESISNLAKSIKKKHFENNARAVMQLFHTLGILADRLKTFQDLPLNTSNLEPLIQEKSRLIYRRFKPFVENRLLKYSYYKFFLVQAFHATENFTQLCQSDAYRALCISEYDRFLDNYHCAVDQFPHFLIDIKNNNQSEIDLHNACMAMRRAEAFVPWMEDNFDFRSNYNLSQYTLHLSASEKDFFIDKFLFEQDDPLKKSYSVPATYFQVKQSKPTDSLLGSAYTYSMDSATWVHEYIHHLTALFINNLELDLTLIEGLAELNSVGICSKRHIRDLRNFVNDTFIFEFFKVRKYPFYFNALKWVAYLVNEQPELFKRWMGFLQKNDTEGFYDSLDAFIDNDLNRQAFVNWSHQQVNTCNTYLINFPQGHQPPILYLKDISAYLNKLQNFSEPNVILSKRDLSSQALELDVYEAIVNSCFSRETQERSKERWQRIGTGIPLYLTALFAGMTSSILDDVGLIYKDNYPSLPAYLTNSFKPFVFAGTSAGLNAIFFDQAVVEIEERFARFFVYFVMNFLAVVIAQPINKQLADWIQNKALNFFVQMMTWTLLWNPSLFLSESSQLFSTLFLQVTQALCFKVGEETYQIGKKVCSPFWKRKTPPALNIEAEFLNSDNDEEPFVSNVNLRVFKQ